MDKDMDKEVDKTEDEVVEKKPTKKASKPKKDEEPKGKNPVIDTEPTLKEMEEELELLGLNIDEAAMSLMQRRKKAMIMRKYAAKIKMGRKRMAKRAPTNDRIKKIARKRARDMVRQKMLGQVGKSYGEMDASQKIAIDNRVAKKTAMINRIAKKIFPKVKRDLLNKKSKVNEEFEMIFEAVKQDTDIKDREGTQPAKYHSGLSKSTKEKRDAHFKKGAEMDDDNPSAYKPAPGDAEAKTKVSKYTKKYKEMYGEEIEEQTGAPTKRFHTMYTKEGKIKLDGRLRAFKKKKIEEGPILDRAKDEIKREKEALKREHERELRAAKVADARASTSETVEFEDDADLVELVSQVWEEVQLEESKTQTALQKKAEKSGISYGILKKVYDRGVAAWRTGHRPGTTPAQWGMARVNSFITGGKTRTTADADLAKKIKEAVSPAQQAAIAIAKKKYMNEEFSLLTLDEQVELQLLDEEGMLDKIMSILHKYVTAGTDLTNIAYQVSRASGVNKSSRELEREYIKKYGDPKLKPKVDKSKADKLKKKYGFSTEEGGAGEWGTSKLANRYKKDTPGQDINEAFEVELAESRCDLIGHKQIKEFEKLVDRLFDKLGIDFNFTRHFGDRMSDERNTPCITMKELGLFMKKIYLKQGKSIKGVAGAEAVIKDIQSDLNIPIVVTYDRKNDEFDVVMKTIMRKKNFRTPNKVITYK